ncbi:MULTISPECIES: winged helix-turn-helix domain-containing protein [Candidatus Williamhamiltonella]|uniref:Transcriptional regulator n=1 Tax=Candidatus Williamhamiltonella defendens TaxID=138072 RepID=A0A2D3TD54_9ENTR|nr:winged helix-turn-helix domain-containing protein [Candidatus Hamiltonella defensa]ATW33746.1 transcriptional regulator [Candidatus Hamiltonella defensa]AYB48223.1 transcriptional regulator [Candidatus Hamiltonella defensa]
MNNILSHSEKYIFGEFTLTADALLSYKNNIVKVPPKEFSILMLLLDSAGVLISKDDFLEKVWPNEFVSEESLTRCIYVLRRLLHENKNNRYIDTVYGKGYRFIQPVTQSERFAESQCSLAVLPFKLPQHFDSLMIHDFLIQSLSKYTYSGLNVLPSTLINSCKDYDGIMCFLEKMKPNYYLSAHTINDGDISSLRIELIRTHDHSIVHREKFDLCDNVHLTCLNLQGVIHKLLARHIPSLNKKSSSVPVMKEFDTTFAYLNAHHKFYSHKLYNIK